jgi:hypothetical protein
MLRPAPPSPANGRSSRRSTGGRCERRLAKSLHVAGDHAVRGEIDDAAGRVVLSFDGGLVRHPKTERSAVSAPVGTMMRFGLSLSSTSIGPSRPR